MHGGELRLVYTAVDGHKLLVGIEGQDSPRSDQVVPVSGNPEEDLLIRSPGYRLGVFAQDEWRISDQLVATLGLRVDRNNVTGTHLSPRTGLIWQATPATTVKALYGSAHRAPNAFERDYDDRATQVGNPALQVERNVMFLILTLIVLVAALNIVSGLIMLVKDKGHDIAILRTMGATRGSIMRIFSMTGTAIGVIGTGVGLVLGLILAANAESLRAFISNTLGVTIFPPEVFFLSTLPSKVNPTEVTVVVCLALGLSFLATIYPAWRAAQYDPVEALRYE